jgi:hypothetical protein
LGLSEDTTEGLYITYHHNWYDHSDSRHPRVRFYSAHVYNNYYDGNAKYGIGSTEGSSVFSEGNYFRNCKYPMLTSMQGSDVWDEDAQSNDYGDMPTFSSEDGGTIKAFNNYIEGARRFVPYGDASYSNSGVDFDAVVVSTRDEQISSSVTSAYGSNTYNNFDTDNSVMYSYTAESPEQARTTVMNYSGRMSGGDFQWTFNNSVDDTDYAVNMPLKTALLNYATTLTWIQDGGNIVIDTTQTDTTETDTTQTDTNQVNINGDIVHNFTTDGVSSDYFSISGNLSTSRGTVLYGGLTLTQCLKIESATSISFSLESAAQLTLIFNETFNDEINIDGTDYGASSGVLQVNLATGSHTITKTDVANLYLMSLVMETTEISATVSDTYSLHLNGDVLQVMGPAKVEIFSAAGKPVRISQTDGEHRIQMNSLSRGVYWVRMQGAVNATQMILKD